MNFPTYPTIEHLAEARLNDMLKEHDGPSFEYSHGQPNPESIDADHEATAYELEAELESLIRAQGDRDLVKRYIDTSTQCFCGRYIEPNNLIIRDSADWRIHVKVHYYDEDNIVTYVMCRSNRTQNYITARTHDVAFGRLMHYAITP